MYSNADEIELLPALPESGFDRGTLTGLKTRNRATVTRLQWDLAAGTVQAVLTADVDRDFRLWHGGQRRVRGAVPQRRRCFPPGR